MSELKLEGEPRSRSMLVPVVLALVLLAAAGAWFAKVYLHPAVRGSVLRVELVPIHSTYAHVSGAVGADQAEDELYVLAQVRLENASDLPLFVKALSGSMTGDDGTVMQTVAMQKEDLPRLLQMFPQMKPAAQAAGPEPLLRESTIAKGASATGYVILPFNIPQAVWDKRKGADLRVEFYHTDAVKLALPR